MADEWSRHDLEYKQRSECLYELIINSAENRPDDLIVFVLAYVWLATYIYIYVC